MIYICKYYSKPIVIMKLHNNFNDHLRRHSNGYPFKASLSCLPFSSKVKTYSERRVLGYSNEQLFEVVSRVEDYRHFLPACTKSVVTDRRPNFIKADLEISFPPLIVERFTSNVILKRPSIIISECSDGQMFKYMKSVWKFSDGLPNYDNTCTLDYDICFELKSYIHAQLIHLFFDQVVRQTVNCFLKRAQVLYGKQKFITNSFQTPKS